MGSAKLLAAIAILALGLWADIHVDLPGQLAIGALVWLLFLALIAPLPAPERRFYLACVAIATAGELFLSLVWGLYTYRLGNVPMFVPPGHALMLMLGLALMRRMPEMAARAIFGGAGASDAFGDRSYHAVQALTHRMRIRTTAATPIQPTGRLEIGSGGTGWFNSGAAAIF